MSVYRTPGGSPPERKPLEGLTKIWHRYLPDCPNCGASGWYVSLIKQCSRRPEAEAGGKSIYSTCAVEAGFGHSHRFCEKCEREFIVDIRDNEQDRCG